MTSTFVSVIEETVDLTVNCIRGLISWEITLFGIDSDPVSANEIYEDLSISQV